MELLVNSVNENNGNICRTLATLVKKFIMTVSESDKSMTAARYKNRVNACLANRVVSL